MDKARLIALASFSILNGLPTVGVPSYSPRMSLVS
ncbi:hypothetical protein SAMN05519104_8083 [Rhizobiales bacterium GAS188]|nr:hypothetical protein SAMN05519104_8083 [Rhizobiales bacterium GAS188]